MGVFQVTFDKEVLTRSVSLAGDVFDPAGTLTGGIGSVWYCVCMCMRMGTCDDIAVHVSVNK